MIKDGTYIVNFNTELIHVIVNGEIERIISFDDDNEIIFNLLWKELSQSSQNELKLKLEQSTND